MIGWVGWMEGAARLRRDPRNKFRGLLGSPFRQPITLAYHPNQVHSVTLLGGSGVTPRWRSMFRHWARWCMAWVVTWVRTAARVRWIVRPSLVRRVTVFFQGAAVGLGFPGHGWPGPGGCEILGGSLLAVGF